jgi:hypothetical protein
LPLPAFIRAEFVSIRVDLARTAPGFLTEKVFSVLICPHGVVIDPCEPRALRQEWFSVADEHSFLCRRSNVNVFLRHKQIEQIAFSAFIVWFDKSDWLVNEFGAHGGNGVGKLSPRHIFSK